CSGVDANAREEVSRAIGSGARVLAVAVRPFGEERAPAKTDECDLRLAGALLFRDPDKPGVGAALRDLAELGIHVKVITGDHEVAARVLCSRVGLNVEGSIVGQDLDRLSDDDVRKRLPATTLFARINPVQKE